MNIKWVGSEIWKFEEKKCLIKKVFFYLKAPPSPWRLPKPNGEKKSVSVSIVSNKLFFSNKLSDISKNEAKGLLEPKNCAKVALGSPWNWYEKLCAFDGPFDVPNF